MIDSETIKQCPFCEELLCLTSDAEINGGEAFLECPTCGLRFKIEGFDESPVEIKGKL